MTLHAEKHAVTFKRTERQREIQATLTAKMCVCGSQVNTKSVAQCVEFYYTYKKHVKIGRNGTLMYGEAEPPESKTTEEETDHKVSFMFSICTAKAEVFLLLMYRHLHDYFREISLHWENQNSH